jgi:rRNA biogenesis protein RRP5
VLAVEPTSSRIILTTKKSLVESKFPALHRIVDARVGMVTNAVVHKLVGNGVVVEYYNNLKAFVPQNELTQVLVFLL